MCARAPLLELFFSGVWCACVWGMHACTHACAHVHGSCACTHGCCDVRRESLEASGSVWGFFPLFFFCPAGAQHGKFSPLTVAVLRALSTTGRLDHDLDHGLHRAPHRSGIVCPSPAQRCASAPVAEMQLAAGAPRRHAGTGRRTVWFHPRHPQRRRWCALTNMTKAELRRASSLPDAQPELLLDGCTGHNGGHQATVNAGDILAAMTRSSSRASNVQRRVSSTSSTKGGHVVQQDSKKKKKGYVGMRWEGVHPHGQGRQKNHSGLGPVPGCIIGGPHANVNHVIVHTVPRLRCMPKLAHAHALQRHAVDLLFPFDRWDKRASTTFATHTHPNAPPAASLLAQTALSPLPSPNPTNQTPSAFLGSSCARKHPGSGRSHCTHARATIRIHSHHWLMQAQVAISSHDRTEKRSEFGRRANAALCKAAICLPPDKDAPRKNKRKKGKPLTCGTCSVGHARNGQHPPSHMAAREGDGRFMQFGCLVHPQPEAPSNQRTPEPSRCLAGARTPTWRRSRQKRLELLVENEAKGRLSSRPSMAELNAVIRGALKNGGKRTASIHLDLNHAPRVLHGPRKGTCPRTRGSTCGKSMSLPRDWCRQSRCATRHDGTNIHGARQNPPNSAGGSEARL